MGDISQIVGTFLPSYYMTDALTAIFLRGAVEHSVFQTIVIDFAVISIVSVLILIAGIFFYEKYGNK